MMLMIPKMMPDLENMVTYDPPMLSATGCLFSTARRRSYTLVIEPRSLCVAYTCEARTMEGSIRYVMVRGGSHGGATCKGKGSRWIPVLVAPECTLLCLRRWVPHGGCHVPQPNAPGT